MTETHLEAAPRSSAAKWIRSSLLVAAALTFGCAAPFPAEEDWHPLLKAEPSEGKALLYLYTWGDGSQRTNQVFFVDEKKVVTLHHKPTDDPDQPRACEFTVVELNPRNVVVTARLVNDSGYQDELHARVDREVNRSRSVTIEPNEVYFVRSLSYSDRSGNRLVMGIAADWVTHELAFKVLPRCKYLKY